jgi:hypothetical protein
MIYHFTTTPEWTIDGLGSRCIKISIFLALVSGRAEECRKSNSRRGKSSAGLSHWVIIVSQYGRSNPGDLRLSEARHLSSVVGVIAFTLASDPCESNETKVGKLQHLEPFSLP